MGLALIAISVSVLCICLGQSMAAQKIEQQLEDNYTTVALMTTKYQKGVGADGKEEILNIVPWKIQDWVGRAAENYPDVVEAVDSRGFASAYISELNPENPVTSYTTTAYASASSTSYGFAVSTFNEPYAQTMLVVELEEIGETRKNDNGVTLALSGEIQEVVQLMEGYTDPTGYTVNLTLNLPDIESADALGLNIGQKYMVYGRDYRDLDWEFRCSLYNYCIDKFDKGIKIDYIDLDKITYFNEQSIETNRSRSVNGEYTVAYLEYERPSGDSMVPDYYQLTNWEMNKIHHINLTVASIDGAPAIAPVQGAWDAFVKENTLWSETLTNIRVNARSFPVIGTNYLVSVPAFAQENARITQGRDFSEEEITSGAKVCILSEKLAQQNGIAVGDILTFNYYEPDKNAYYQDRVSQGEGIINPTAYYFTEDTPYVNDGEAYTVVGLYNQDEEWQPPRVNLYAFTNNTIFVPHDSVSIEMDYANQGMFLSLIITNGKLDEFRELVAEAGREGLFEYFDQGYEMIHDSLHDYAEVAKRAVIVGLIVYIAVLALYLILFPGMQGPVLNTMSSLGAGKGEKLNHILSGSFAILIPGTVLGVLLTVLSWERVVGGLVKTANVNLTLALDVGDILLMAAVQLLFAGVLVFLMAVVMAGRRTLMNRGRVGEKMQLSFKTWSVWAFAAIVTLVLCELHSANEQELADFEEAYAAAPVTVSVMDFTKSEKNYGNFTVDPTAVYAFTRSGQNSTIGQYLKNVEIIGRVELTEINNEPSEYILLGITSVEIAEELTAEYNAQINWLDGWNEESFFNTEGVCIVPEGYTSDGDSGTDGQQLILLTEFGGLTSNGTQIKLLGSDKLTVIGTYVTDAVTNAIYCSYENGKQVQMTLTRSGIKMDMDVIKLQATLKDNELMDELYAKADRLFVLYGSDTFDPRQIPQALDINDDAIKVLEATLESSLAVNRACTLLVFILSAGAGFFLGFLMIRQRKREIILMRTLGKPNAWIYRDFALEQMLALLAGAFIGGLAFLWQPTGRLVLFALVYFAGLSAALVIFLRSTLLTTIKEDE